MPRVALLGQVIVSGEPKAEIQLFVQLLKEIGQPVLGIIPLFEQLCCIFVERQWLITTSTFQFTRSSASLACCNSVSAGVLPPTTTRLPCGILCHGFLHRPW